MNNDDKKQLENTYVSLSQQGASLVHHVSTPVAIARVNVDFLNRYLKTLLDYYGGIIEEENKPAISSEHQQALLLAPQLINQQLDAIQTQVKQHWQSMNQEVMGQIPEFQVISPGDVSALNKILDNQEVSSLLLVEDEAIHRDIALKILEPMYSVEIVANGEEAIRRCQDKRFDLILMDMYLPGINGQDSAKEIREGSNRDTTIIGLTNMPLGEKNERSYLNASLSKPLTKDALDHCLNKLLELSAKER